jgi:thymidine kinase
MFLEKNIHNLQQQGWIEVITGSMFSGKTEELIRRLKRAQLANLQVEIYKPTIDTRYSKNSIVSHNSAEALSTSVESAASILLLSTNANVIGIDEAQFFDKGIVDVCNTLANNGKRVVVAGLDMDFKGNPFGFMSQLMAIAEYTTKLQAICMHCGNLAHYSHRKSKTNNIIELGELSIYEPLCRMCFKKITSENYASI